MIHREPQSISSFAAGDPCAGYYNDLTGVARSWGTPRESLAWLDVFTARRQFVLPVSVVQLGLGAWQLSRVTPGMSASEREICAEWGDVASAVVEWVCTDISDDGLLLYHQPMPHTYHIDPPWASAMAQGQALSLLVRAAIESEDDAEYRRVVEIMSHPLRDHGSPLVDQTADGPVLQEYPTKPASHVLNGWIWALWGLYDVALLDGGSAPTTTLQCDADLPSSAEAFDLGVRALANRLPLYEVDRSWSRYDLYPHRLVHVASPFYHRLHIAQLKVLSQLLPAPGISNVDGGEFAAAAERWSQAFDHRATVARAVARKVAFRLAVPRRRSA